MNKRMIISLVIIVLISILSILLFYNRNSISEKTTNLIIIRTEKYLVNIRYPQTVNDSFNEIILNRIQEELISFQEIVDNSDNDFQYILDINYSLFNNSNLTTIQFDISQTLYDEEITSMDFFYYDSSKNIGVSWEELFTDEKLALDRLTNLVQVSLFERGLFLNISSSRETFQYLIFDTDNIIVLLPELSSFTFEYSTINEFLTYKGGDRSISEDESFWVLPTIDRKTRDVEEFRDKKILLLTFDDGPGTVVTNRLLNELAERDARVTFFVLGSRVKMFPDIVRKAHKDGHTIASHGYSHRSFLSMSHDEIINEINVTNQLISNITMTQNRYIRPPYGHTDDDVFAISNMSFVLWNIDPKDWRNRNSDTVYQNIMRDATDGGIVVLHDLYQSTVDGTIRAIDSLLAQGWAIISLEEAEKMGYLDPDTFKVYKRVR